MAGSSRTRRIAMDYKIIVTVKTIGKKLMTGYVVDTACEATIRSLLGYLKRSGIIDDYAIKEVKE